MPFPTHELLYKLSLKPNAKKLARDTKKEIFEFAIYVSNSAKIGRIYSKTLHHFFQLVPNQAHSIGTYLISPQQEEQSEQEMLEDKLDKFVRLLAKDTSLDEEWIQKLSSDLCKRINLNPDENHMFILSQIEAGTFPSAISDSENELQDLDKKIKEAQEKLLDYSRIEKLKKEKTEVVMKSAQNIRAEIYSQEKHSEIGKKTKADLLCFLDGCIKSKDLSDLNEKWQAKFHEDLQKNARITNAFSDDLTSRIRTTFKLSTATELVELDSKKLKETIECCQKEKERLTHELACAKMQCVLTITDVSRCLAL